MIIALCFTESSLRYDVIHRGIFDLTTEGICGLKHYWDVTLLKGIDRNSLYAGSIVFDDFLAKSNGDEFLALSHYKGAIYNYETVLRVLEIKEKL